MASKFHMKLTSFVLLILLCGGMLPQSSVALTTNGWYFDVVNRTKVTVKVVVDNKTISLKAGQSTRFNMTWDRSSHQVSASATNRQAATATVRSPSVNGAVIAAGIYEPMIQQGQQQAKLVISVP